MRIVLLHDVACVLAETTRSQAYIQALARNHLKPAGCLVMSGGKPAGSLRELPIEVDSSQFFNLNESIFDTLEANKIEYRVVPSDDINSPELEAAIQDLPQQYLIYSGYGGAILKPHLFYLGKKWIHVHAGRLPHYRGSTTTYYSILEENQLEATAIFLNEKIDEGSIITSLQFPPPDRGELIDFVYDPYIRSCVLIQALKNYIQIGEFPEKSQSMDDAETYYIIHPVLKHIAILSLEPDGLDKKD